VSASDFAQSQKSLRTLPKIKILRQYRIPVGDSSGTLSTAALKNQIMYPTWTSIFMTLLFFIARLCHVVSTIKLLCSSPVLQVSAIKVSWPIRPLEHAKYFPSRLAYKTLQYQKKGNKESTVVTTGILSKWDVPVLCQHHCQKNIYSPWNKKFLWHHQKDHRKSGHFQGQYWL